MEVGSECVKDGASVCCRCGVVVKALRSQGDGLCDACALLIRRELRKQLYAPVNRGFLTKSGYFYPGWKKLRPMVKKLKADALELAGTRLFCVSKRTYAGTAYGIVADRGLSYVPIARAYSKWEAWSYALYDERCQRAIFWPGSPRRAATVRNVFDALSELGVQDWVKW